MLSARLKRLERFAPQGDPRPCIGYLVPHDEANGRAPGLHTDDGFTAYVLEPGQESDWQTVPDALLDALRPNTKVFGVSPWGA
jgi:hypothetical protein